MALDFQNKGTSANCQCQLNSLLLAKSCLFSRRKKIRRRTFAGVALRCASYGVELLFNQHEEKLFLLDFYILFSIVVP